MVAIPTQEQRGTHQVFTVSNPQARRSMALATGRDEDEVTAERNGPTVWGEPCRPLMCCKVVLGLRRLRRSNRV